MKKTLTFRPSTKNQEMIPQLEDLAEIENRSLNNYIEMVLLTHLLTSKTKQ